MPEPAASSAIPRSLPGDFADSVIEMDHRVGQMLDQIDALGMAENTLVIFCSDNGPEFRAPFRGTYHTAMEGSLRGFDRFGSDPASVQ